jgi:hypothetical protein
VFTCKARHASQAVVFALDVGASSLRVEVASGFSGALNNRQVKFVCFDAVMKCSMQTPKMGTFQFTAIVLGITGARACYSVRQRTTHTACGCACSFILFHTLSAERYVIHAILLGRIVAVLVA